MTFRVQRISNIIADGENIDVDELGIERGSVYLVYSLIDSTLIGTLPDDLVNPVVGRLQVNTDASTFVGQQEINDWRTGNVYRRVRLQEGVWSSWKRFDENAVGESLMTKANVQEVYNRGEIDQILSERVPAGVIQMYAGMVPPEGYLSCDGAEVSRSEYSDLFAAIGTTWGSGDGLMTFNIPKLTYVDLNHIIKY